VTTTLNPQQSEALAALTKEARLKIRGLQNDVIAVKAQINLSEARYKKLQKQAGWRERYFFGLLSSKRQLVEGLSEAKESLHAGQLKQENLEVELITEAENLKQNIAENLAINVPDYALLKSKITRLTIVFETASHYERILTKAKNGINEALAWTSWNSLINHPDAKKELAKFRAATDKLQQAIDSCIKEADLTAIGNGQLSELICFETQAEAMENFGHLLEQTNKYKKLAGKILSEAQQQEEQFIQTVLAEVTAFKGL